MSKHRKPDTTIPPVRRWVGIDAWFARFEADRDPDGYYGGLGLKGKGGISVIDKRTNTTKEND